MKRSTLLTGFLLLVPISLQAAFVDVSSPVPISDLLAPGAFTQVGDLIFSNFTFGPSGINFPDPTSSEVFVKTSMGDFGLQGLEFGAAPGAAIAVSAGQALNFTISYQVLNSNLAAPITRVSLGGFDDAGPDIENFWTTAQRVQDFAEVPIGPDAVVGSNGINVVNSASTPIPPSNAFVTGAITFLSGGSSGFASLNGYVQIFETTAVPEASTLSLCGLAAVGGLAAAWRKRRRS